MSDFRAISQDLVQSLSLQFEPVGVTLYKTTDSLPSGIPFTEGEFKSYCQAIILAGQGKSLLLKKEQMGCKLGTSVLGFEKEDLERYLDDGVLEKYGVGLFGTEEASARTILDSTFLETGKTQAAYIAPLSLFTETPQVVVFTADSEQVMWLLYAVNYETGGQMDLPQSGGALGGCSDITVLSLLTKGTNITFLGLGCRLKMGIDPCHLLLGTAGQNLGPIHSHVLDMAKPIAMLNKQRSTA